ncbi:MAG: lipoate--protein ligase family protein, partial [Chloroflexota bacterium]
MIPLEVAHAAEQLTNSEALWREVAAGAAPPTLRWYSYNRPALVLGVGQAASSVDEAACQVAGVEVVRRTSGGATVPADEMMLALDVALPAEHPLAGPDVLEAYRWLGETWLVALRRLVPGHAPHLHLVSVPAARADQAAQRAARAGSPEALRSLACFGVLSPYEVALGIGASGGAGRDGHGDELGQRDASGEGAASGAPLRKLVGFSQIRKRGVVMFQTGLYTRFRGSHLARLLAVPVP